MRISDWSSDVCSSDLLGPNLWAIGGKVSGTTPGFKYSPALTKAKIKWDRASLINFITNPRAAVPGNRMAYAGQKDKAKAAAVADCLMSLKYCETASVKRRGMFRVARKSTRLNSSHHYSSTMPSSA